MLATQPEGGNRHLRLAHAETLASLIRSGNFYTTHQGIAFNTSGELIDGQHRLQAIVLAGQPATLMVTLGLPREVMDGVDRGATRTVGDLLQLVHGISGGSALSSVCAMIQREVLGNRQPQTVASALEVYRRFKPGIEWVLAHTAARTAMNKASYRAAWALAWPVCPEVLAHFLDRYKSGEHTKPDEPAWRLREFTTGLLASRDRWAHGDLVRIAASAVFRAMEHDAMPKVCTSDRALRYFLTHPANLQPTPEGGAAA